MPQQSHKLVALDLDGTVITSEGHPDPNLPPLTARLRDKGIHTVICTGRRWRTTLPVLQHFEHIAPAVVCCGGALIKDGATGETLHDISLQPPAARNIVSTFHDAGLVPFLLYDFDLTERELLVSQRDLPAARKLRYVRENESTFDFYEGDYPAHDSPALEVYTVDDVKLIKKAEKQIIKSLIDDEFITTLHQPGYPTDQWVLQVHNKAATKWNALLWLMDRWNVRPSEVVAIGDDVNDVPMLDKAGLSFAPANAVPEARNAADRMTNSNDDGGIVMALEDVFF